MKEILKQSIKQAIAKLDLTQLEELIIEAEGLAWRGWFCEIFAEIDKDGDIYLSLGAPLSNGYTPCDNVVGSVDCWFRKYNENEAEEWAEECGLGTNPEDFDSDECMKYEASNMYQNLIEDLNMSDIDLNTYNDETCPENLIENIAVYARSEGYEKLVIENY